VTPKVNESDPDTLKTLRRMYLDILPNYRAEGLLTEEEKALVNALVDISTWTGNIAATSDIRPRISAWKRTAVT
jgi:hypothetical protein